MTQETVTCCDRCGEETRGRLEGRWTEVSRLELVSSIPRKTCEVCGWCAQLLDEFLRGQKLLDGAAMLTRPEIAERLAPLLPLALDPKDVDELYAEAEAMLREASAEAYQRGQQEMREKCAEAEAKPGASVLKAQGRNWRRYNDAWVDGVDAMRAAIRAVPLTGTEAKP